MDLFIDMDITQTPFHLNHYNPDDFIRLFNGTEDICLKYNPARNSWIRTEEIWRFVLKKIGSNELYRLREQENRESWRQSIPVGSTMATVIYSRCSWLQMLLSVLFLFTLLSVVACESTFDCYHDKCIRGLMYCVNDRQRCYNCADRVRDCDSDRLPRDCDAFCVKHKFEFIVSSLNSTADSLENKISELHETVAHKNASIAKLQLKVNNTRTESDNRQSEIFVLKRELNNVGSKLNKSERENGNLKVYVQTLEKIQENVNRTLRAKLKSSKEENVGLQKQFQVSKWTLDGLIIALVFSVVINVLQYILYCVKRKGRHQPNSTETAKLIDEEKTTMKVMKNADDINFHNHVSINVDVSRQDGVKDNSVEKSGKRDSGDSGLADSGSNSSINKKDGGDKGSSCDLHPGTTDKKITGPEAETECECGHPKSTGVKQCTCKSQIPPTEGKNGHADLLYN